MDAIALKAFFDGISAMPTAAEQVTALSTGYTNLNDVYESLVASSTQGAQDAANKLAAAEKSLTDLQSESTAEIGRLSTQLAFYSKPANKGLLTVEIDGKTYTTPAGRSYKIGGNIVKAEDLVKDIPTSTKLVAMKSSIFTAASAD